MQLKMTLDLTNDAFCDEVGTLDPSQVASALSALAQTLARYHNLEPSDRGVVLDRNGNTVGRWATVTTRSRKE